MVLAGPGNNGGDAFVAARVLRSQFHDVHVVFAGDAQRLPADAAAAYRAFVAAGGTTLDAAARASRPALVVDGLFGIGLSRPPEGRYADLVEWANASGAPILALDIPTGLDAATGQAHAPAIRASATATFIALKPGLLTRDGPDHCGDVVRAFARARRDGAMRAGTGSTGPRSPPRCLRCSRGARATSTRARSARSASWAAPKGWAAR